jgi:hypothetical protein
MIKSQFLYQLKEPLDLDLQMVAVELDTSAKRLKFVSASKATDAYEIEQFNKTYNHIKESENSITNINDNTELFELSESLTIVVLYEDLNDKFIIYDVENEKEIKSMLKK